MLYKYKGDIKNTNPLLHTSKKSFSKKSFSKKRRERDLMTNKKIGNPDSIRSSAAKKIQRKFRSFTKKRR